MRLKCDPYRNQLVYFGWFVRILTWRDEGEDCGWRSRLVFGGDTHTILHARNFPIESSYLGSCKFCKGSWWASISWFTGATGYVYVSCYCLYIQLHLNSILISYGAASLSTSYSIKVSGTIKATVMLWFMSKHGFALFQVRIAPPNYYPPDQKQVPPRIYICATNPQVITGTPSYYIPWTLILIPIAEQHGLCCPTIW